MSNLQNGDRAVMEFVDGRFQLMIQYVSDWGDIKYRKATPEERKLFARSISQMINGSYM